MNYDFPAKNVPGRGYEHTGVWLFVFFGGIMGNPLQIDEQAIKELKALSPVAKEWISHHIRNGLQVVLSGSEIENKKWVHSAIHHIAEDLKRIGC